MIRYYYHRIKWMWAHRDETNCRQKWRRMEKELSA